MNIIKLFVLICFLLMFLPIGLCEKFEGIKELNNIKIYDENDKIISIYDKDIDKSMDIKLISTLSDIDKLIKIVEVTNYIEYIPNKENDFITKTKKIYGKNNIYKIEYFIEKYNYTFENITISKTIFNKTGKNETKLINKSIIKNIKAFWVEFKPYNRTIFKNETFKLKIIHYKKPELGFFKIQTIPIFKNIECDEFTWWNGNWNLKRPILINNTYGDNVTDYQLKSVNLSEYQINASSTRIINETSGLQESFWNETTDNNGNLEYVWCNYSSVLNGSWINETYYIYYQSNPNVNSVSNGDKTFFLFENGSGIFLNSEKWVEYHDLTEVSPGTYTSFSNGVMTLNPGVVNAHSSSIVSVTTNLPANAIVIIKMKSADSNEHPYHIVSYGNGALSYFTTYPHWGLNFYNSYSESGIENKLIKSIANSESILDDVINGGWGSYNILDFKMENSEIRILKNDVAWLIGEGSNLLTGTQQLSISAGIESNGGGNMYIDYVYVRKYTLNEPELWTVGNIEYPEDLDMNCSLKIITHLTEKEIKVVNMTGDIVNISKTNECINLSYDSYILYMSNPVKISSFTELLNTIDNVFIQFFLFAFLIVIGIIFFTFLQIIKNRGFKGVTK